jgi:hypothetical protein
MWGEDLQRLKTCNDIYLTCTYNEHYRSAEEVFYHATAGLAS